MIISSEIMCIDFKIREEQVGFLLFKLLEKHFPSKKGYFNFHISNEKLQTLLQLFDFKLTDDFPDNELDSIHADVNIPDFSRIVHYDSSYDNLVDFIDFIVLVGVNQLRLYPVVGLENFSKLQRKLVHRIPSLAIMVCNADRYNVYYLIIIINVNTNINKYL